MIGRRIKLQPLLDSVPTLVSKLGAGAEDAHHAAVGITTTDLVSKSVAIEVGFCMLMYVGKCAAQRVCLAFEQIWLLLTESSQMSWCAGSSLLSANTAAEQPKQNTHVVCNVVPETSNTFVKLNVHQRMLFRPF